jgi:hypothetical protein
MRSNGAGRSRFYTPNSGRGHARDGGGMVERKTHALLGISILEQEKTHMKSTSVHFDHFQDTESF